MTTTRNDRRNKARAIKWRAVQIIKACNGCADCGINDSRVLDLDHVTGNKVANVSDMISGDVGWSKIVTEISKCDIVCANCHRIRTHTRKVA